jgi:hypothetical protein
MERNIGLIKRGKGSRIVSKIERKKGLEVS